MVSGATSRPLESIEVVGFVSRSLFQVPLTVLPTVAIHVVTLLPTTVGLEPIVSRCRR